MGEVETRPPAWKGQGQTALADEQYADNLAGLGHVPVLDTVKDGLQSNNAETNYPQS